jgi:hypothetical protein
VPCAYHRSVVINNTIPVVQVVGVESPCDIFGNLVLGIKIGEEIGYLSNGSIRDGLSPLAQLLS